MQDGCNQRSARPHRRLGTSFPLIVSLWLFCASGVDARKKLDSGGSKASLVFSAQCQLVSEPFCDDPKVLRQFLEQPHIRNLFLSAGGQRPCQTLSVSPQQNNQDDSESIAGLWRQACERYYGLDALPEVLWPSHEAQPQNGWSQDLAALATETEVKFPGFKTVNTVLNGCRRFEPSSAGEVSSIMSKAKRNYLPFAGKRGGTERDGNLLDDDDNEEEKPDDDVVYKFYLIGDRKRCEGPAPIVWLVKKLTGDNEETPPFTTTTGSSYRPSETRAVSKVSIFVHDPINDGESSSRSKKPLVGFRLDITCTVQVEFSRLLLKLLPAPQSTVEERGTKSIQKAILHDATMAVEAVQQEWLREQQVERSQVQTGTSPSSQPAGSSRGLFTWAFRRRGRESAVSTP